MPSKALKANDRSPNEKTFWEKWGTLAQIFGAVIAALALYIAIMMYVNSQTPPPPPPPPSPVISNIQGPSTLIAKSPGEYSVSVENATGVSYLWDIQPQEIVCFTESSHGARQGAITASMDLAEFRTKPTVFVACQSLREPTEAKLTVYINANELETPVTKERTIEIKAGEYYYVYTDAYALCNGFPARGYMGSPEREGMIDAPMNEKFPPNLSERGHDCIECSFVSAGDNWAGWYFMAGARENGALIQENSATLDLLPNWGKYQEDSVDLSGAQRITFWAKGATGGERVSFFALGIGWDIDSGERKIECPFPDSSNKVTWGADKRVEFLELTNEWKQYAISLAGLDLTRVVGGFGWATNSHQNNGHNITFYLDDIQYEFEPAQSTSAEHGPLKS